MAATPAPSNFRASSIAPSSDASAQPSTATLPPRASMPTAILPGNALHASFTSPGSRTATVPRMTRARPFSSHASIWAMVRMPPPSCTGFFVAFRIAPTAAPLRLSPATPPPGSTTGSHPKPCSSRLLACAAGSSLSTVALAISPSFRRTHWPPFRSMAGKRIIASHTLDYDEPRLRGVLPEFDGRLVFGRVVAFHRLVVAVELDDDVAGAGRLLRLLVAAGADDEFRAVLLEGDGVGGDILLVRLGVGHIDQRDPVALFAHVFLLTASIAKSWRSGRGRGPGS